MRRFIVLGHGVATTPGFSLDDLPGAGRLDVLCRCVSAGLLLSHGIREGTRVDLVLDDAFTVRFDGATVRHLHPDERNVAARIQGALEQRDGAVGRVPVETSPGVRLVRAGVEAALADAAEAGSLIRLAADGDPIAERSPPDDPAFVLSDHREFTDRETELLAAIGDARVRLGPERLHADHAITVAHNWLDTARHTRY